MEHLVSDILNIIIKIAIVYSNISGNILMIVNKIKENLIVYKIVYFVKVSKDKIDTDLFIGGLWNNKGNTSNDICESLKKFKKKEN